jgi:vacuolar protein sorting-associated protein 51
MPCCITFTSPLFLAPPACVFAGRYLAGREQRLRRVLKDAAAVADAMAAAAAAAASASAAPGVGASSAGSTTAHGALHQLLESPVGSWGFGEDGSPPGLRQFVRALDEKLINAVQETVMNVMRFFMPKVG